MFRKLFVAITLTIAAMAVNVQAYNEYWNLELTLDNATTPVAMALDSGAIDSVYSRPFDLFGDVSGSGFNFSSIPVVPEYYLITAEVTTTSTSDTLKFNGTLQTSASKTGTFVTCESNIFAVDTTAVSASTVYYYTKYLTHANVTDGATGQYGRIFFVDTAVSDGCTIKLYIKAYGAPAE